MLYVTHHPGKWTTMERGIQYLRELAMWEMVYYDLVNTQLSKDPYEVQCTQPMWWKFVWSTPSSYVNSLAVIEWKGEEAPTVDEVEVSSSVISALEKPSQKVKQFKENMFYSPPLWTSVSSIRRKHSSAQEKG
ncbi:hypothetical protein GRJ2_002945500 [Grus japonensis]|uniref:Uncharacterized protein n=1 Tax=Grus japonensis TaxID=30415 RepID=A0ABC9Y502_GRUJA